MIPLSKSLSLSESLALPLPDFFDWWTPSDDLSGETDTRRLIDVESFDADGPEKDRDVRLGAGSGCSPDDLEKGLLSSVDVLVVL